MAKKQNNKNIEPESDSEVENLKKLGVMFDTLEKKALDYQKKVLESQKDTIIDKAEKQKDKENIQEIQETSENLENITSELVSGLYIPIELFVNDGLIDKGITPINEKEIQELFNLLIKLLPKDTFQKIIEIDTTNSVALNYVGYTYAEQNDSLEYALQLINKALLIEENNGHYIDSRAWVFYKMGRYEEALKELKKAAGIIEDAVIFEHLGDVYLKLDDIEKARDAYEKALEHEPESKILKEKLQHISE